MTASEESCASGILGAELPSLLRDARESGLWISNSQQAESLRIHKMIPLLCGGVLTQIFRELPQDLECVLLFPDYSLEVLKSLLDFLTTGLTVSRRKSVIDEVREIMLILGIIVDHQIQEDSTKTETGGEGISCQNCGKAFPRKNATYYRHLKRHEDQKQGFPRPLVCPECPVTFKTKYALKIHAEKHSAPKSFICDECGFPTTTKFLLQTHQLTHKSVKKYQCNQCEKSFNFKYSYESHVRKHKGESPFRCPECRQSFVSNIHRTRHQNRVHRKQRNFACSLCQSNFKDKAGLQRHVILHSEVRPFQCEACGDCFKHREGGRRHIKSAHPDEGGKRKIAIRFVSSQGLDELQSLAMKKLDQLQHEQPRKEEEKEN